MSGRWVAGVDGCRAGWVLALGRVRGRRVDHLRVMLCPDFGAVLAVQPSPRVWAVDMPIGLLTRPSPGGRLCDRAARRVLGRRASSVFSPPTRPLLAASRYDTARRAGLTRQAFGLLPKIREVDALMSPRLQRRVLEAHPELAFATGAGHPMRFNKKTASGRRERLRALRIAAPNLAAGTRRILRALEASLPSRHVAADDLLDAVALVLTAHRVLTGRAVRLPDPPPRDRRGLRMEIWS